MKILLLYPPYTSHVEEEKKGYFPPLGLAYIAAILRNHNHSVRIIDMNVETKDLEELEKICEKEQPDIVGISSATITYNTCINILKRIKNVIPSAIRIVGGPHASILPHEFVNYSDFVVIGEGEYTMLELVKTLENGEDPSNIEGLLFKKDGKIVETGPRPLITCLDNLPFPARDLLHMEAYNDNKGAILTSRGCPFNCIFCNSYLIFGKKFRARSPKNVVDEIEYLVKKYNVHVIRVLDDMFTLNRKRVIEICNEILNRGLNIEWELTNGTRVNKVDKELLEKMHEAGCYRIYYGIESGSEKVLKMLRKGIKLDQVRRVVKWTKEIGIEVGGFFMIGGPGETTETLKETEKFIDELNLDYVHLSIATPYPRTDFWNWVLKNGRFVTNDYSKFEKEFIFETPDFPWEQRMKIFEYLHEKYCSNK